jgi:sodium-dependent phosphate cotransporter
MNIKASASRSFWILTGESVGLLLAFLIALKMMILSFKLLNIEVVEQIILATANPFLCLFIGLLTTALIHSSSTITAMTIAIVASGTISIENAVYMIMGANIGTTVTATIVSLGHAARKKEFRKAISASMAHHFFNVLTAIIFFPLEYYFGFLSGTARNIALLFTIYPTLSLTYYFNPIEWWVIPIASQLIALLGNLVWLSLVFSIIFLFYVLHLASNLFRKHLLAQPESRLEKYLFGTPSQALIAGIVVTVALQSSTVVTSLLVPVVAANKLSIKRVFPFIMGANIGTTIKAILASFSTTEAAFTIALTHLLFNVLGALIFFPFADIRQVPVNLARRIGKLTLRSRSFGFLYISLTFFIAPFILIYFSREPISIKQYTYLSQSEKKPIHTGFADDELLFKETRIFYKQTNQTNENIRLFASAATITMELSPEFIRVNEYTFRLAQAGDCQEEKDEVGVYRMCLETIHRNFRLNNAFTFDICYEYTKRYTDDAHLDRVQHFYISPRKPGLLRYEVIHQSGRVLFKEELINIVN